MNCHKCLITKKRKKKRKKTVTNALGKKIVGQKKYHMNPAYVTKNLSNTLSSVNNWCQKKWKNRIINGSGILSDSSKAIAASEGRPKPGKTKSVWEMTGSVLMGNQGGGSKEGCSENELGTYLRSVLLSKTSSDFFLFFCCNKSSVSGPKCCCLLLFV